MTSILRWLCNMVKPAGVMEGDSKKRRRVVSEDVREESHYRICHRNWFWNIHGKMEWKAQVSSARTVWIPLESSQTCTVTYRFATCSSVCSVLLQQNACDWVIYKEQGVMTASSGCRGVQRQGIHTSGEASCRISPWRKAEGKEICAWKWRDILWPGTHSDHNKPT